MTEEENQGIYCESCKLRHNDPQLRNAPDGEFVIDLNGNTLILCAVYVRALAKHLLANKQVHIKRIGPKSEYLCMRTWV